MLAHRRKANLKRADIGRGKFRWGPRVDDRSIAEVTFECRDMLEEHISDEDELALVVVDGVAIENKSLDLFGIPREQGLTEAEEVADANAVAFSSQSSRDMLDSSGLSRIYDPEPHFVPLDIQDGATGSSFNTVLSSHRTDQVSVNDARDEDFEHSDGDLDLFSDEISALIEETDTGLPIACGRSSKSSVLEWMKEHQVWIELFNKHGIKISVMDEILKNLKAPVNSWKTIIANVCKEASLNSQLQSFVTCPGHVCYANLLNSPESNFCSDCGSSKPQATAATSVQYIPILPRIQSILLEEQSCKSLFQYHQTFQSVPGTYADYFDSASYRRLCSAMTWEARLGV